MVPLILMLNGAGKDIHHYYFKKGGENRVDARGVEVMIYPLKKNTLLTRYGHLRSIEHLRTSDRFSSKLVGHLLTSQRSTFGTTDRRRYRLSPYHHGTSTLAPFFILETWLSGIMPLATSDILCTGLRLEPDITHRVTRRPHLGSNKIPYRISVQVSMERAHRGQAGLRLIGTLNVPLLKCIVTIQFSTNRT